MPALKRNLAYDAVRDFAPIVLLADATLVLLVRHDLPAQSVAQLIGMMRDRPGQLNYSTGGYGSPHHLATITLFQRAGLPHDVAVHVPFAGLAPALMALLGGNAQFMITSTGAATQHIASGRLRPLATTSLKRSPRLPKCRPWQSSAIPASRWLPGAVWRHLRNAVYAIVTRWNKFANDALRDPKVRDQISALDYDIRGGTAKDFADFVASRYRPVQEARRRHGLGRGLSVTPRSTTLHQRIARASLLGLDRAMADGGCVARPDAGYASSVLDDP